MCCGATAESSALEGFDTYIIKDATKSVDEDDLSIINKRLEDAGVKIIGLKDIY